MSFINTLYQKSVAENEHNLRFWEDYLNNLKMLDFSIYADKLKVPTLVPIGSRIFFRGELKHTNEVTVALGADYFVKCSLAQAEVLRQHRIKDAETKLESFQKEKEYLENQLSLTHKSLYEKGGQEIVEVFTEEEDKAWRKEHSENVRKYIQGKAKDVKPKDGISDEELWNRLEELELEEELENELLDNYNEIGDKRKENKFLIQEEEKLLNSRIEDKPKGDISNNNSILLSDKKTVIDDKTSCMVEKNKEENKGQSKLQLLQQVLDKQNQLEDKLLELKNRDRQPSKSEQDLMFRLDEMEQLDELEDEMERLEDILETEDVDSKDEDDENNSEKTSLVKLKKGISFADVIEDTCETIEITYKHSEVEPSNDPYDAKKGIVKPSDIYEAHANLFKSKPTSILKKSKYDIDSYKDAPKQVKVNFNTDANQIEDYPVDSNSYKEQGVNETIIIKDVVENPVGSKIKINTDARPSSLFKQRRMLKRPSQRQ